MIEEHVPVRPAFRARSIAVAHDAHEEPRRRIRHDRRARLARIGAQAAGLSDADERCGAPGRRLWRLGRRGRNARRTPALVHGQGRDGERLHARHAVAELPGGDRVRGGAGAFPSGRRVERRGVARAERLTVGGDPGRQRARAGRGIALASAARHRGSCCQVRVIAGRGDGGPARARRRLGRGPVPEQDRL